MMCRGILATDMEHHMDHVKELQNHSGFTNSREDRTFLVEISMHTSDLSNPVQPWRNSSDWAIRVAKEFVIQYEKETELGLAQTPHFNLQGDIVTTNPNIAKLNIGFVNYLVKPLWVTFVDFFPKWADRIGEFLLVVICFVFVQVEFGCSCSPQLPSFRVFRTDHPSSSSIPPQRSSTQIFRNGKKSKRLHLWKRKQANKAHSYSLPSILLENRVVLQNW